MTSKRRENKNLVSFICFSFLVISFEIQGNLRIEFFWSEGHFNADMSRDAHVRCTPSF